MLLNFRRTAISWRCCWSDSENVYFKRDCTESSLEDDSKCLMFKSDDGCESTSSTGYLEKNFSKGELFKKHEDEFRETCQALSTFLCQKYTDEEHDFEEDIQDKYPFVEAPLTKLKVRRVSTAPNLNIEKFKSTLNNSKNIYPNSKSSPTLLLV